MANDNTRRTNDYSPLIEGSKPHKQAVAARAEMLRNLSERVPPKGKPERKSHDRRVRQEFNIVMKKAKLEAASIH